MRTCVSLTRGLVLSHHRGVCHHCRERGNSPGDRSATRQSSPWTLGLYFFLFVFMCPRDANPGGPQERQRRYLMAKVAQANENLRKFDERIPTDTRETSRVRFTCTTVNKSVIGVKCLNPAEHTRHSTSYRLRPRVRRPPRATSTMVLRSGSGCNPTPFLFMNLRCRLSDPHLASRRAAIHAWIQLFSSFFGRNPIGVFV